MGDLRLAIVGEQQVHSLTQELLLRDVVFSGNLLELLAHSWIVPAHDRLLLPPARRDWIAGTIQLWRGLFGGKRCVLRFARDLPQPAQNFAHAAPFTVLRCAHSASISFTARASFGPDFASMTPFPFAMES
jgi:hypothetical protein